MLCPKGHGPLTAVGQFLICGQCGFTCPNDGGAVKPERDAPAHFADAPSILAIPLNEYFAETHPIMRLHRLCDAVEIVTRFCAIVALGEVRRHFGNRPFSDPLLKVLQPQIERPTFAQWKNMLAAMIEALPSEAPLVVPELPPFVVDRLLPKLLGGHSYPEECLVTLRNQLVHGGAMTTVRAEELLNAWDPWLDKLSGRLEFFRTGQVCHYQDGVCRLMSGRSAETSTEFPLSAELRLALRGFDGKVLLLREGRWLDLWPLCDYRQASANTLSGPRKASTAGPQIFFRAEPNRLLYAALGVDLPQSERSDVVAQFNSLFQLAKRLPNEVVGSVDFDAELQADSSALVGREQEIDQALALLKPAASGVFWIAGPGGIGKSFLMARLAERLAPGSPRHGLRIAWRFKTSDQTRCNRSAFFRHAIERLVQWKQLGKPDVVPSADPRRLLDQLRGLLNEVAGWTASSAGRPARVIFVLDGLDEIARSDPDFAQIPCLLRRPNVVWLCAGRLEGSLAEVFALDRCTHVFKDGLPAMNDADIRGLLLEETARLKYELLALDIDDAGHVTNRAIESVIRRAQGLPLYVHLVVQDLLAGHLRADELDRKLPASLNAYYDDLLRRMAIGDLQALLSPLMATIAWAHAPLDEQTLHLMMVRRTVVNDDEAGRLRVRRGLAALQSMIRPVQLLGVKASGYEPYHPTFGDHIRQDPQEILGTQNRLAREAFVKLAQDWAAVPADHPAHTFVLRYGPTMLQEAGMWDDLESLLTDVFFWEAKNEAGLVFELATDLTAALALLPEGRPRCKLMRLLNEALRRDIHFIHRHRDDYSQALFQCLWNHGWWYDCPEATKYYAGEYTPANDAPPKLYQLLDRWKVAKKLRAGEFRWLRSLRPPPVHLGGPLAAILRGHTGGVTSVAVSGDGRRIVSGSRDKTLRIWDAVSGILLITLQGHEGDVMAAAWSADGRRIVSGGADKTVRLWDATSGAALAELRGHTAAITSVAFSPLGRQIASGSDDKSIRLWEATSGVESARLTGHESSVNSIAFSPDDEHLVTGSDDKTVRLWNAASGACQDILFGHDSKVKYVAYSADGRQIISVSTAAKLLLWDAASGAAVGAVAIEPGGPIASVATLPTSGRVAIGTGEALAGAFHHRIPQGSDHVVIFGPNGKELARLRGHQGSVAAIAAFPDGRRLISGSADGTLRIWVTAEGREQTALLIGHDNMTCAAVCAGGRSFACCQSDGGHIWAWDAVAMTPVTVNKVSEQVEGQAERQVSFTRPYPARHLWYDSERGLLAALKTDNDYEIVEYWLVGDRAVEPGAAGSSTAPRAAAAVGKTGSPLLLIKGTDESFVRSANNQQPLAFFPVTLGTVVARESGHGWTALDGTQLYVLMLEGSPKPVVAQALRRLNNLRRENGATLDIL